MPGSAARQIENIMKKSRLRAREVAELLGTTPETISRWRHDKVRPRPDRLGQLTELESLAEKLAGFYPPEDVRLWFFSPNHRLEGERPFDRICTGGVGEVLHLLTRRTTTFSKPSLGKGKTRPQ